MTKPHLLGVAKVRRRLMIPIIAFSCLTALSHFRAFGADWRWMVPLYALFDSALWLGVAFVIFAVIEWRQKLRPQPRVAALAAATVGMCGLVIAIITIRAFFESIVHPYPFATLWLHYLPGGFFNATFYVAIVTGIGYAVHSSAVDERRLAEAAELDAAIARAELKAAAGRLQPEVLDAQLARLSALIVSDPAGAQQLIADLGALLHESLAVTKPSTLP